MSQTLTAAEYWEALTAGFGFFQSQTVDDLIGDLTRNGIARAKVRAHQLALMGTGYATPGFEPDGDVGTETRASLENLYRTAHQAG